MACSTAPPRELIERNDHSGLATWYEQEAVRLRHLIEFQGTVDQPVRFLTLRGLTLRHAARTFMDNKEPLLRSDWTTYRGGAVFLEGTENCTLADCFLDQPGGNAVFASRRAIRGEQT